MQIYVIGNRLFRLIRNNKFMKEISLLSPAVEYEGELSMYIRIENVILLEIVNYHRSIKYMNSCLYNKFQMLPQLDDIDIVKQEQLNWFPSN